MTQNLVNAARELGPSGPTDVTLTCSPDAA